MGYPALNSGMALSPRGFGSILAMVVVGRLVGKVDTRVLTTFGFVLLILLVLVCSETINLQITWLDVAKPTSFPELPWD